MSDPLQWCCGQSAACEYGGCYPFRQPPMSPAEMVAAARATEQIPYMMENTPEEFERVIRIAWPPTTYGVCLRYQEVRGDRLAFSCECNGDGCPDGPRPVR